MASRSDFVLEDARIVLREGEIRGWLAIVDGRIAEIGEGVPPERGVDFGGDFLLPGLIELHTDHLESHLRPRPKVNWPTAPSIIAYDYQLAASGITTVFDSIRVGNDADYTPERDEALNLVSAISNAASQGLLRVDHKTHLRCEICAEDVLSGARDVMAAHHVDLVSLMDHTPGARQFASLDAWRTYYGGKSGLPYDQLETLITRKRQLFERNYVHHRTALVDLARAHGAAIASHDDTTPEHVEESIADRVEVAEFPTNLDAASLSHAASIAVLMGAPNVVRGGSHSGNVAAETLAREGVLDILSSDYVPGSLLVGAFELARRIDGYELFRAIRTVSLNPAQACGLADRGEVACGKIADLLRVRIVDEMPFIAEVYRNGLRIV
ncbi:MAG: alpha-D-ribose 1-methylphosphonate 5-triphosphate diphosphatase [Beijerinckiaceae bacterium]